MEKKIFPELSPFEKTEVLLARVDKLAEEILKLPLTDDEKKLFDEIREFRFSIGDYNNGRGEATDIYKGEELKEAEKVKNDFWDLKMKVLKRLRNEASAKDKMAVGKKEIREGKIDASETEEIRTQETSRELENENNENVEELGDEDIIEQIYTPQELEEARHKEIEDTITTPTTIEFYNKDDKARILQEQEATQRIVTISDVKKEEVSANHELKVFDSKITEKFAELGINSGELSKIKEFEALSTGQQFLVLDAFRQFVLGQVKERALEKYNQELRDSGFFGRIGKAITKKYQIAKLEKSGVKDLLTGGLEKSGEILKQISKATKEQGVEAVLSENGDVEIQYASLFEKEIIDRLISEDKEKVKKFNKAATALSKIPYEWSLESVSRKQRQEFLKIKQEFENAKREIMGLGGYKDNFKRASANLIDIENKLRFYQFISVHPEVEKELKNIQTRSAWAKIRKDIIAERGIYAGLGFGAAGINAASLVAAGFVLPIGSVISGAAIARWRAKEILKEQDIMARRGIGFPIVTEEQQKILKEKYQELLEKEQWLKSRFPEYIKAESDYLDFIVSLNKKEKAGEAPTSEEIKLLEELKAKYQDEQKKVESDSLFLEYVAKKAEYENLRNGIFKSEQKEEIQKNFVEAKSLVDKIEWLMKKIESEKDEKKKEKLIESLRVRLDYSEDKIRDGLVNFGFANERLFNYYGLVKSVSDGFAFIDSLGNPQIKSDLYERLEKVLSAKKEKISKARKKYIAKKMGLGALYAAGFYGMGFGARKLLGLSYDYWQSLSKTSSTTGGADVYIGAPNEIKQTTVGGQSISDSEVESIMVGSHKGQEHIGTTAPATEMKPTVNAGSQSGLGTRGEQAAVGGYESKDLAQEISIQPIGKRGPEGAIIDYLKANPDVAKKLGYQKEMDFNKWVETKAFQLWINHSQEAIKNPDIQEILKELGYAPDEYIKGYEEMMRHIQHGGVKINFSKNSVDLINMEYLKFKTPAVLEDIPTETQIDVGLSAGVQIDEGILSAQEAIESTYSAPAATETFDNVISINALPSVEWFAFEDMKFSIGEFAAIKNISVEKLLKEIPSQDEAWAIWRGEVEGKEIDLPHYGAYWYTQFRRQVNLAEFIRRIVKEKKIKPEVLKNISVGKFIEKYIVSNIQR